MFALFLVFHDPAHRAPTRYDAVFIYQDFSLVLAREIRKADSTSGKVEPSVPARAQQCLPVPKILPMILSDSETDLNQQLRVWGQKDLGL